MNKISKWELAKPEIMRCIKAAFPADLSIQTGLEGMIDVLFKSLMEKSESK